LERALPDPDDRVDDHGQHGRLDAEQEPRDRRQLAEACVEHREQEDREEARQDEARPGDDAARSPVGQPADVGDELHRLRTGQQRAVVQRVQEARLADPLLALDELAVHHRDLPGRPAEALQADAREHSQRFRPGDGRAHAAGEILPPGNARLQPGRIARLQAWLFPEREEKRPGWSLAFPGRTLPG
jgi:hypothetical protein